MISLVLKISPERAPIEASAICHLPALPGKADGAGGQSFPDLNESRPPLSDNWTPWTRNHWRAM